MTASLSLVIDSGEIEAERTTFLGEFSVFLQQAGKENTHGRNRTVPLMLFGFREPERNLFFLYLYLLGLSKVTGHWLAAITYHSNTAAWRFPFRTGS